MSVRVFSRTGVLLVCTFAAFLLQARPAQAYVGNYKALYWSALRHEALGHFGKSRSRHAGGLAEQRRWWRRLDDTIEGLKRDAETERSAKQQHLIEMELAFLRLRVEYHQALAAQAEAEISELSKPGHGSVPATVLERQFVFLMERKAISLEIAAARAEQEGSDYTGARDLWTQATQARAEGAAAIHARLEQLRGEQAAGATSPTPPGIVGGAPTSDDASTDAPADEVAAADEPGEGAVTVEPESASADGPAVDTMQACIDYLAGQEQRFGDYAARLQAELDWATDPSNILARSRYFEEKAPLYGGMYRKVYERMAEHYRGKAAFACDLKAAAAPDAAEDMADLKEAILGGKADLPDAAAPTWYYPVEYELRLYEFSLGAPEGFAAPPAS